MTSYIYGCSSDLYLFTYTGVVSNSISTSRYVRLRDSNYPFDISSNHSHCKGLFLFYKGLCFIHVVFRTGWLDLVLIWYDYLWY